MIRNFVIIILSALLGASSYILYTDKIVSINIGGAGSDCSTKTPDVKNDSGQLSESYDNEIKGSVQTQDTPEETQEEYVERIDSGEPEIHMDPTVGMSISSEQQIVSSYKVIGPRKFSLLTDKDETMVEIDLDTGSVKINPKYKLDEVTTQFWKSVGEKYPEVCFVEK